MSDDKLVRRDGAIAPADDFAARVEEELRERGDEIAQRAEGRACLYAYKLSDNEIWPCTVVGEHVAHSCNSTGGGVTSWRDRCTVVNGARGQCRYQRGHEGSHECVREEADSFELIGEVLRNGLAFQEALVNKLMQRAPIMQSRPAPRSKTYQISFGSVRVRPGESVSISVVPQIMFRGDKLVVGGNTRAFIIEALLVGGRLQYGFPVPAAEFAMQSLRGELSMDVVEPAIPVTMQVRNIYSTEETFDAVLFGRVALF